MVRDSCRAARLLPLGALLVCSSLAAQQSGDQSTSATGALQKATQNPVGDLTSVPLQNNINFNVGPYNGTQNVLNIEPVIPMQLTENCH